MKALEKEIIDALVDKKWHSFVNFIPKVNKMIPPELAVRYYLSNFKNPGRDLEDQVRIGRRRILAETFRDLRVRGAIEFRNPITPNDQDSREYHLIASYVQKSKEKKKPKAADRKLEVTDKKSGKITELSKKPEVPKKVEPLKKTTEEIVKCIEILQDEIRFSLDDTQNKNDIISLLNVVKKSLPCQIGDA
jgi:uncharacterized FlaG/YvyC family protein